MPTDEKTAEQVDMYIGGTGDDTDWGKLSPDQQKSSVDEAYAEVQAKRNPEVAADVKAADTKVEGDEQDAETTTETPADGDDDSVVGDAAPPKETDEGEEGEGDKGEPGSADWLDDDAREIATAMGLNEEDLSEFGSREELDRVLRLMNRNAFDAGKAGDESDRQAAAEAKRKEQAAYQQQQDQRKQQDRQAQDQPDDPFADLAKFKLGDEFDQEAAKPLNDFVEAAGAEIRGLRSEVAQLKEERAHEAAAHIRTQALESLHSLGHTELFGKPGDRPTKEQAANIAKAIDAHLIQAEILIATDREVAPTPAFLKFAVGMEFEDELKKYQQKQLTQKLRKQSSRRTGGSAARSLSPVPSADETPRQRAERYLADGLGERFKELTEQS